MLLHSTASSSTFGAHLHHPQPLLHLNLMNMLSWMFDHPPRTPNLMDGMPLWVDSRDPPLCT